MMHEKNRQGAVIGRPRIDEEHTLVHTAVRLTHKANKEVEQLVATVFKSRLAKERDARNVTKGEVIRALIQLGLKHKADIVRKLGGASRE